MANSDAPNSMIWLIVYSPIIVGIFVGLVGWGVDTKKQRRLREAKRLRDNINRLERELFPHWFPKQTKTEFFTPMAPGARWTVDDVSQIHELIIPSRRSQRVQGEL